MQIEINEKEIMTDVINYNGTMHSAIRSEITNRMVNKIVDDLEETYFDTSYYARSKEEITQSVLEELEKEQRNIFKKILKSFKDKYRWSRNKDKLEKFKKIIDEVAEEALEEETKVD